MLTLPTKEKYPTTFLPLMFRGKQVPMKTLMDLSRRDFSKATSFNGLYREQLLSVQNKLHNRSLKQKNNFNRFTIY